MSQLYEKDGVTPWDGRDSKDPFDYGIKYEAVSLDDLGNDIGERFKKEIARLIDLAWKAGIEYGRKNP